MSSEGPYNHQRGSGTRTNVGCRSDEGVYVAANEVKFVVYSSLALVSQIPVHQPGPTTKVRMKFTSSTLCNQQSKCRGNFRRLDCKVNVSELEIS